MSSQVQPAVPDMVESTVRTVGALAPSHRRHRAPSVDDIQKTHCCNDSRRCNSSRGVS